MKKLSLRCSLLLLAAGLAGGCVTVPHGVRSAPGSAALARELVAKNQAAIVTVQGTLKVTMTVRNMGMNQENETPVEATGLVVDPAGLVVVGTLLLDPVGSIVRNPIRVQQGDQTIELEMKSRLENLRLLLPDKTEVPARLVLRDDDLGLAVLAAEPARGVKPPVFTPLALGAEELPQLYATYLVLGRANEMFQRAPLLGRGIPVNTLTKPRTCQVLLTPMMPVGMPVFSASGRLVGIGGVDFRKPDFENPSAAAKTRPLPILLPVSDVRDLVARAQQKTAAPAAAPPAPAATAAFTTPSADRARALTAANQGALVTLRGTVKFTDGSSPRVVEEKIECLATIVDATGFAICGSGGRAVNRKYQEQRLNYVLRDGTEVPARIVLQDDDLALTVLAPAPAAGAKTPALPCLPLKAGVHAQLFDDVLIMSRLDSEHHFTLTADIGKVTGVITQPHPFYLTDGNVGGRNVLGAPILLADGRLLGLLAMTPQSAQPRSRGAAAGPLQSEINVQQELVRVVPAAALNDLVEQARKVAAKK